MNLSAKTNSTQPAYIFISLVMHLGILWAFVLWQDFLDLRLTPYEGSIQEPIIVEVFEGPMAPGDVGGEEPEEVKRISDLARRFLKETSPEDTPGSKAAAIAAGDTKETPAVVEEQLKTADIGEDAGATTETIETTPVVEDQLKAADIGEDAGAATDTIETEPGVKDQLKTARIEENVVELKGEKPERVVVEDQLKTADIDEDAGTTTDTIETPAGVEDQLKTAREDEDAGAAAGGSESPAKGEGQLKLFPTGERLIELSKRYEAEAPDAEKGKRLQLNTSESKYNSYLIAMKQRIELYWEYPLHSIRRGNQGKLSIKFTINRGGELDQIELVNSSNHPALDDAALTAIKIASPFNPFPEDFGIEEINITGNFEYSLITRKIRRRR